MQPRSATGPVVVTGAAGFAGSHLVEHLSQQTEIIAWARSAPPAELAHLARWQQVDLLDRERVRALVREVRPARVFHSAGLAHVAESWADTSRPLAVNVRATHHLLDALRRSGVHARVLITGSATVYAASDQPVREDSPLRPASPYALSKLAQEQLGLRAAVEDGVDVVVTRSFNHTGARQRPSFVAPGIAQQIARIEHGRQEAVIHIGNTDAQRDFLDIRDIVRAYAGLMDAGAAGTIYNIASGVARSVRSVLDGLIARARVPIRIEVDPARLRPSDTPILVGDATRLHETTGWTQQVPFDRMLDDLLAYWRQVEAST
ncbi:MAG TPA: GDP-mannose 4,6-dehydratase [Vicinamibacterales bacterium]|nr:GDP-mannose 4,6-dehydratase [Vicinamibacterales bacterium]